MNYLVLVNKLNPIPEDWTNEIKTEHFTNCIGEDVEVESKAYQAYLDLKKELSEQGIEVDLDSALRSFQVQQEIMETFTKEYGSEYAAKVVAVPGLSEHHTGLALDLFLIVDGKPTILNEEMVDYPEIWEQIHQKLSKYGFILRYPEGREHITGYTYEPWHIRYIDDKEKAAEIMAEGISLEEYLGAVSRSEAVTDLGTSALYSEEERKEMSVLIKCRFAANRECVLHSLCYGGDDTASKENLAWLNEHEHGGSYTKSAGFLMGFHSPKENAGSYNPDYEYKDYQWWLGYDETGGWEIVDFGY